MVLAMKPTPMPVSRLDYCQYLISSQINYTLTNFADHTERFSHDALNRYLADDRIPPRLVWENVRAQLIATPTGYLVFDDTVLDKRYSRAIDLVRRQYSGNAHGVIKGIGVVTCVYVNPELDRFWIIDYRIYDPDGVKEGDETNLLTIVPNETYETFAAQYQEQIKEIYGTAAAGSNLRKKP